VCLSPYTAVISPYPAELNLIPTSPGEPYVLSCCVPLRSSSSCLCFWNRNQHVFCSVTIKRRPSDFLQSLLNLHNNPMRKLRYSGMQWCCIILGNITTKRSSVQQGLPRGGVLSGALWGGETSKPQPYHPGLLREKPRHWDSDGCLKGCEQGGVGWGRFHCEDGI